MAHHEKMHNMFTMTTPENIRRRRIVSILSLVLVAAVFFLVAYYIGYPLVQEFRDSPETFRAFVKSYGPWGPLLMIGLMALQVIVAIVPGGPFELGAGFVFGWVEGSILCLIGSALATTLVYLAVRKWGVLIVESFFPREKIMNFSFLQNEKKLDMLIFILFLIPGTPKDMLTYLVGLTPMKLSTFLILTTVARAPSVIASAITGSLAHQGSYLAAIITYAVTLLLTLICVIWYKKSSRKDQAAAPSEETKE